MKKYIFLILFSGSLLLEAQSGVDTPILTVAESEERPLYQKKDLYLGGYISFRARSNQQNQGDTQLGTTFYFAPNIQYFIREKTAILAAAGWYNSWVGYTQSTTNIYTSRPSIDIGLRQYHPIKWIQGLALFQEAGSRYDYTWSSQKDGSRSEPYVKTGTHSLSLRYTVGLAYHFHPRFQLTTNLAGLYYYYTTTQNLLDPAVERTRYSSLDASLYLKSFNFGLNYRLSN